MDTSYKRISDIVANRSGLQVYSGDLIHYFQKLFFESSNLHAPYHNFRHTMHVLCRVHEACAYYSLDAGTYGISLANARDLHIAAIFHDFNHSGIVATRGQPLSDSPNITRATQALSTYILETDLPRFDQIRSLVHGTCYPHTNEGDRVVPLELQILRDADMMQAFDPVWMQQIIFGLAKEKDVDPFDVLLEQESFVENICFYTEWARQKINPTVRFEYIKEVRALIGILSHTK